MRQSRKARRRHHEKIVRSQGTMEHALNRHIGDLPLAELI